MDIWPQKIYYTLIPSSSGKVHPDSKFREIIDLNQLLYEKSSRNIDFVTNFGHLIFRIGF